MNTEINKKLDVLKEALLDGPAGRALSNNWNRIHDLENELESALHEYDVAASYTGKPGERDAKKVMASIQTALRALGALHSVFDNVHKAESAFIRKHGSPEDYADKTRSKMFPR